MSQTNSHIGDRHLLHGSELFELGPSSQLHFPPSGASVRIVKSPDATAMSAGFQEGAQTCLCNRQSFQQSSTQIFAGIICHGNNTDDNMQITPGRLTVTIPDSCDSIKSMTLKNVTGFEYPEGLSFGDIQVEGTGGPMSLGTLEADTIVWKSRGGAMNFYKIKANSAAFDMGMGNLEITVLSITQDARFAASGGDLSITDAVVASIDIKTSMGNVDIKTLSATEAAKIKTSGGTLKITDAVVADIGIETSMGNVDIKALSATEAAEFLTSGGAIEVDSVRTRSMKASTRMGQSSIRELDAFNIELDTTGGDISCLKARSHRRLSIATTMGNVVWKEYRPSSGNVDVKTSGGRIGMRLAGSVESRVNIQSTTGDVALLLQPSGEHDFRGVVDATTSSGRFDTERGTSVLANKSRGGGKAVFGRR